jgi:hypothetical protein
LHYTVKKKDATTLKRGNAAVLRNPIISVGTQCNHGLGNSFRVTLRQNNVNDNTYLGTEEGVQHERMKDKHKDWENDKIYGLQQQPRVDREKTRTD